MNPRSTQRGFTLVEVMVAMAMLTISLICTLPLLSMSLTKSVHGRKVTTAQYIATSILDRLRFELRADPNAPLTSGCQGSTGCTNGGTFTLDNAWQSEQLPHSLNDEVLSADGPGCNPQGTEDNVSYQVGPFPLRSEGNQYLVCYRLDQAAVAGAPPGSVDARVKILWPSPIGFGSYTLTSTLLGGGIQ